MYATNCVVQQAVFLATLLLADHLGRNRKRLPLLAVLAYILMPIATVAGSAIVRPGSNAAYAGRIALGLTLSFAVLALRLRAVPADLPAAGDGDMPLQEKALPGAPEAGKQARLHPAPHEARLAAFPRP